MPPPSTAITIVVAAHQSIPAPSAILRLEEGGETRFPPCLMLILARSLLE
jgi:hypothetical protein